MFLDNLTNLMNDRKLNKNTLAKESGIPYTTIDGFYKKGCDNVKLSTLTKLSSFFGVSLDYLINGDVTSITPHEREVIFAYRKNPAMQGAVDRLLGIDSSGPTVADEITATLSAAMEKSRVKK